MCVEFSAIVTAFLRINPIRWSIEVVLDSLQAIPVPWPW